MMSRSTRLRRPQARFPRPPRSPRPRTLKWTRKRLTAAVLIPRPRRQASPAARRRRRNEHRKNLCLNPSHPSPSRPTEEPLADDEPAPELVWYVLKVQSSREDTIRDALERRVKIQGLAAVLRPDRRPDREDHRDPQQQEADRRAEDVSRLHHGPDGAEREDLVRGPRDARRRRLRRGPRHADQDDRGRGQPDARTRRRRRPTAEAPKVRIDVERGDRVKIKDGPFENFEGTVEEVIEGRGLVKVMLIIFNRPTPVDLEYWQVERI